MNKRTKDLLVAIVAVGAAAIALYFGFGGGSEKINLDTYEVLGAVTAEETAKLLGNKGQVLVLARGSGANKNPSVEAELEAFKKSLKKSSGLSMVAEKLELTPMQMMATGGGVPPDQLFKALASHPNLGAVVLFFGFPSLADSDVEALKKTGVKIVVVSAFHSGYKQLLERQAIHLAIVPRPDAAPGVQPARTVRERFDQEFLVVTASNVSRLP